MEAAGKQAVALCAFSLSGRMPSSSAVLEVRPRSIFVVRGACGAEGGRSCRNRQGPTGTDIVNIWWVVDGFIMMAKHTYGDERVGLGRCWPPAWSARGRSPAAAGHGQRPKELLLFSYSLQNWRSIFGRFDRDQRERFGRDRRHHPHVHSAGGARPSSRAAGWPPAHPAPGFVGRRGAADGNAPDSPPRSSIGDPQVFVLASPRRVSCQPSAGAICHHQ